MGHLRSCTKDHLTSTTAIRSLLWWMWKKPNALQIWKSMGNNCPVLHTASHFWKTNRVSSSKGFKFVHSTKWGNSRFTRLTLGSLLQWSRPRPWTRSCCYNWELSVSKVLQVSDAGSSIKLLSIVAALPTWLIVFWGCKRVLCIVWTSKNIEWLGNGECSTLPAMPLQARQDEMAAFVAGQIHQGSSQIDQNLGDSISSTNH